MADNFGITPGAGVTVRGRVLADGFLREVVATGAVDTDGATPFHLLSAATINATVVKASAGNVYAIVASNLNAAVRYLKFYDKATAPAPASDSALLRWSVALKVSTDPLFISLPVPLSFASGISFVTVTGISDTDATAVAASEIIVNLAYA